ncbi:RNA methyltransferase [Prochlorococcus sp. MIT 1307]|uniref:TrmH family RNA methyltransferase n=1 Tax=Prochlorococcus sp. MIT 1307 TaxID=3096219 RepID=UPI002A74EE9E|nr:RNA methyltransferase [Prochlorococcus sp. MIT 1307]
MPLISSRRNPLVRRLKALASKEGREKFSLLLLEGTHLLEEALKTSFFPGEIIATSSWLKDHLELLKLIPKNVLFHEVTRSVLEAALTTKNPDGVAALFPLEAIPKPPKDLDFVLALDRLQDPGNLGTLFRTALAAEVQVIWLALGADPLSQKVLRASAGATLHLPYERSGGEEKVAIKEFVEKLEFAVMRGYQVVGSFVPGGSLSDSTCPYWELDWTKPTVLVLGNEGSGLHPLIKSCCTHSITLPHSSLVESLNVASAAVPLLLERRRAKMSCEIHQCL